MRNGLTTRNKAWSERIEPVTGFPKMPALVTSLVRLARDLGPGTRMPRTRELAQALGVTVVTLNQGLTQLERRGFLDRRPRSGIYVSPNVAQKNVGLVIGWDIFADRNDATTFYYLLLGCCTRRAALNQERFSFFLDAPAPRSGSAVQSARPASAASPGVPGASPYVHQDLADALSAGRLDGLLLTSPHGPEQEEWLRSHNIPVVNLSLSSRPGSVCVDGEELVCMGARELMQDGARTIGFITSNGPEVAYFRNAAERLGFETKDTWISHQDTATAGKLTLDDMGRRAINSILALKSAGQPLPKGIVVANDIVARGVLRRLDAAGVRVGLDMLVAVHANRGSAVLTPWEDRIIQCQVDPQEIADTLFAVLEVSMENRDIAQGLSSRTAPLPSSVQQGSDGVWRVLPHVVRPSESVSET